jgi:peptide/nickel transport system permease protein
MAESRLGLDSVTADATAARRSPAAEERIFVASQWQLMWWRFRKHKLALASGVIVVGFYMATLGSTALADAAAARLRLRWLAAEPARLCCERAT